MIFLIPFLSFFVAFVYMHLGFYAIFQTMKGTLHRLFFLVAVSCAFWSFSNGLFHLVRDKTIAENIFLISQLGAFILPAVVYHYILTITQNPLTQKKRLLVYFIYIPAAICYSGLLIPKTILAGLIPSPYGWLIAINYRSFFVWFYITYNLSFHAINVIRLFRWKNTTTLKGIKKQAQIIIITFIGSVIVVIIEELLCKFLQIQPFPSLSHFSALIWLSGIFFVIKKYSFMKISPEKAINEILFNMMDILILTDRNGMITRVNQQLTHLLGFIENELINRPVKLLFEEDLELSLIQTLTQSRKNIKTKKGETISILLRISPIKNKEMDILGFLLIGHDDRERDNLEKEIAERWRVEKSLIESRSQYISTINAMDEIIHVIDADFRIILCNNTFLNVVKGFKDNFLLGISLLGEVFPFLKEDVFQEYKDVFETGKQKITEEQNEIDGTLFFTETRKIPVFRNHRVFFVVTIIRDITEKKKMEQSQLRSGIADSVSLVAGGIAHDYNNLLTTILGNITLAKTYFSHKALHNEALAEAENAGLQAKDLTQQLLTFSQKGTLIKESGDIGILLKKSTSFFLSGSNIKCEVSIPGDLYKACFNKQQIARVFQNLLLNAKEAMPKGGILSICAQNRIIKDQPGTNVCPGKYIEISFIDHGEGIKDEFLSRIFNPYFTTKESGSGLGLATAYSIIKKHGGIIEVSTVKGEGSTFKVLLPADESEPEETQNVKSRELKKGKGSILIMDDDAHVRETLKRLLKHLGYSVIDAENGKQAVTLYKQTKESGNRIDLVILDFTIQGSENGGEVFQQLQQYDPYIKAVVYSGYQGTKDFSTLLHRGLLGVVKKPFDIEELSELLDKIITVGKYHQDNFP